MRTILTVLMLVGLTSSCTHSVPIPKGTGPIYGDSWVMQEAEPFDGRHFIVIYSSNDGVARDIGVAAACLPKQFICSISDPIGEVIRVTREVAKASSGSSQGKP